MKVLGKKIVVAIYDKSKETLPQEYAQNNNWKLTINESIVTCHCDEQRFCKATIKLTNLVTGGPIKIIDRKTSEIGRAHV